MIISKRHGFIFIKTWKTAGSAIQAALARHCSSDDLIVDAEHPHAAFPLDVGHASASAVREYIGAEAWEKFFRFSFVRNPWDVYVSGYWWITGSRLKSGSFTEIREDFRRWLLSGAGRRNYSILSIDGAIAMDMVGRYEALREDFEKVCARLNLHSALPSQDLPVSKGGFRPRQWVYQEYYTKETRDYVASIEEPLVEHFKYRFE